MYLFSFFLSKKSENSKFKEDSLVNLSKCLRNMKLLINLKLYFKLFFFSPQLNIVYFFTFRNNQYFSDSSLNELSQSLQNLNKLYFLELDFQFKLKIFNNFL